MSSCIYISDVHKITRISFVDEMKIRPEPSGTYVRASLSTNKGIHIIHDVHSQHLNTPLQRPSYILRLFLASDPPPPSLLDGHNLPFTYRARNTAIYTNRMDVRVMYTVSNVAVGRVFFLLR